MKTEKLIFSEIIKYLRTESGCIHVTEKENSKQFDIINPTNVTKTIHENISKITNQCDEIVSLNTYRNDNVITIKYIIKLM